MPELQPLPQPLARLRDNLHGEMQGARAEHALGFVAFEATIRWLALCLIRARATLEAPLDQLERVKNFFQRPSFGSWMELLLRYGERTPEDADPEAPALEVLRAIGDIMGTQSIPAGQLRDALRDRSRADDATVSTVPWRGLFSLLPAYRNDFIGHTGYLGEEHYEYYAPLIRSAAQALLAHPSFGKLRLESRNGTTLDLSSPQRATGAGDVVEAAGLTLVNTETGQEVLEMGSLAHLHDGWVFMFDRSPRRGGIEYLEFATGDRVKTESSILKSPLAHALSFESKEGSEKLAIKGRLEVSFQPLRWNAGVGAHLPFRVVLRNHGPVKARCDLEMRSRRKGAEWALPRATKVTIEPGGCERLLLWAGIGAPGIAETPELMVKNSLEGDRPAVAHAATRATITVSAGDRLPMVGRDEVLERLREHLGGGLEPGGATLVTGEAGSGKSTLISLLHDRAGKRSLRTLRIPCAGKDSEPLRFFHDLLRIQLGLGGITDDDALRAAARERLAEYLGDESPAIGHFVAFLMGDPAEAVSPGQRAMRWLRLLAAAASEAPLVLLVDDVHELDGESAELLASLLSRAEGDRIPIAAVLTGRDGEIPEPIQARVGKPLAMQGLSPEAVGLLIDAAYPQLPFRDDMPWLVDYVLETSGGNPKMIAGLVGQLAVDTDQPGLVRRESHGGWSFREVVSRATLPERLPLSYGESAEQEITELPDEARQVMEFAALLGSQFPVSVLERVVTDSPVLDDGLDQLEARKVIRPLDADLDHYRFESGRTLELATQTMGRAGSRAVLKKRRALAAALIEEFGEAPAEAERIGGLLVAARDPTQAFPYLLIALEYRILGGRYAAGSNVLDVLEKAIEKVPELPDDQRLWYWRLRGDLLSFLGKESLNDAAQAVTEALNLARASNAESVITRLLIKLCEVETRRSNLEAADKYIDEALERLFTTREAELARKAQNNLGVLRRHQGRIDEARSILESALADLAPGDGLNDRMKFLINLGVVSYQLRDMQRSEECFLEAIEIAKRLDNVDHEMVARVGLSNRHYATGEYEQAREAYLEAIDLYRQLQNRRGLGRCYKNLADTELHLGRLDKALRAVERSLTIRREIGDAEGEMRARLTHADTLIELTRREPARDALVEAVSLAERLGDASMIRECRIRLAAIDDAGSEFRREALALDGEGDAVCQAYRLILEFHEVEAGLSETTAHAPGSDDVIAIVDALRGRHEPLPICRLAEAALDLALSRDPIPDDAVPQWIQELSEGRLELSPGAPLDRVLWRLASLAEAREAGSGDELRKQARAALRRRAELISDPQLRQEVLTSHEAPTSDPQGR